MRVIVTSVNYADFLAVTLPAWRALLPMARIRVLTSPEDLETQDVALASRCECLVVDVWHKGGAVFNKAAALDIGLSGAQNGDWCLALDADVYPIGHFPAVKPSMDRALFSVHRYSCPDPEQLRAHLAGELPLSAFERIQMWKRKPQPDPAGLQGYFQLWQFRDGDSFGDYPTAAKYDVAFGKKFPRREYLDGLYVLHLGEHRRNWSGRVTPRWDGKAIHSELA
jgi:hypothetical protein